MLTTLQLHYAHDLMKQVILKRPDARATIEVDAIVDRFMVGHGIQPLNSLNLRTRTIKVIHNPAVFEI